MVTLHGKHPDGITFDCVDDPVGEARGQPAADVRVNWRAGLRVLEYLGHAGFNDIEKRSPETRTLAIVVVCSLGRFASSQAVKTRNALHSRRVLASRNTLSAGSPSPAV